MTAASVTDKSIIIEGSPISFALMGPKGNHRGVILRSSDRSLDLIGLDDRSLEKWDNIDQSRAPTLFRKTLPLTSHIVRSDPRYLIEDVPDESRSSHLSFAWKGLASTGDKERIEHAFSTMAPDIYSAVKWGDPSAVEWQIAPLISLCQRTTERVELKHEKRRTLLFIMGAAYALVVLVAIVQYIISRYIF